MYVPGAVLPPDEEGERMAVKLKGLKRVRIIGDGWYHVGNGRKKVRQPMRVTLPDWEADAFIGAGLAEEVDQEQHPPAEPMAIEVEQGP